MKSLLCLVLLSVVSFNAAAFSEETCMNIIKQKSRPDAVAFVKKQVADDLKKQGAHGKPYINDLTDDQVLTTGFVLYCQQD